MLIFRLILVIVSALALAACGSSSQSSTTTSSTTPPDGITEYQSDAAQCATTSLDVSVSNSDAGAGNRYLTLALRNKTTTRCVLAGYPGMALYNGESEAVSTVTRSGAVGNPVVLEADQRAYFDVHYVVVESGTEDTCVPITRVAITPPNNTEQLLLPITQIDRLCVNGGVSVSSVRATSAA